MTVRGAFRTTLVAGPVLIVGRVPPGLTWLWPVQAGTAKLGEATATELRGWGWDMRTDAEMEFVVDLATGTHTGGPKF